MQNKRGISPLIATVLLVAFAVAIGAVVSNYVIKQTKDFKPEKLVEDSLLCDEVSLGYSIDPIGNPTPPPANEWLCIYSVGNSNVLAGINVVNKGKFSIHKYSVITKEKSGSNDEPAGSFSSGTFTKGEIKPGEKQQMFFGVNINTDENGDNIIRIIPIVQNPEVENEFVKCTKSALVIDYFKLCADINNGMCKTNGCQTGIDTYKTENLND